MDRHNRGDLREEGQKKKKKTMEPRGNKKLWEKKVNANKAAGRSVTEDAEMVGTRFLMMAYSHIQWW